MRSLLRSKRPTTLARALAALGRIPKTLYMLAYVDDEHFRRRILTQLGRGENRHRLARAVFHGQRGELRQRYREGQEDQLGAPGLVAHAIVLWNTPYMEAALEELSHGGYAVCPEDAAGLAGGTSVELGPGIFPGWSYGFDAGTRPYLQWPLALCHSPHGHKLLNEPILLHLCR